MMDTISSLPTWLLFIELKKYVGKSTVIILYKGNFKKSSKRVATIVVVSVSVLNWYSFLIITSGLSLHMLLENVSLSCYLCASASVSAVGVWTRCVCADYFPVIVFGAEQRDSKVSVAKKKKKKHSMCGRKLDSLSSLQKH